MTPEQEVRAARAHASRWRRNVGELVGVQAEGTSDSELHRMLQHHVVSTAHLNKATDALGRDYPPFARADEVVNEMIRRLTGDGVVDAEIIDEGSDNYRSGYATALIRVALLLGYSRDRAAVITPNDLAEALRTLRLRAERCDSCPWSPGTACGGAEGVCEGNVVPLVAGALELPAVDEPAEQVAS